jgi:hypothetical protein
MAIQWPPLLPNRTGGSPASGSPGDGPTRLLRASVRPLDESIIRQRDFCPPAYVQRQAGITSRLWRRCLHCRVISSESTPTAFVVFGRGVGLLPCPCLPLLCGHYPASWLVRRLCHLLGTVLRTRFADHERRHCSQFVIPDSQCIAFHPFRPHPPSVLCFGVHWIPTEAVVRATKLVAQ